MPAMIHTTERHPTNTMTPLTMDDFLSRSTWFYRQDGHVCGPLTEAGFSALVRMGYVKNEAMVWQNGQAERALSTMPDKRSLLASPFIDMPALVKPLVKHAPVEAEISFENPPSLFGRTAALFIDSFLIGVMSVVLIVLIIPFMFGSGLSISLWTILACWFGTASLYFSLSESGAHGATLGKRLLGLRVVSEAKKPVGLLRGLWRGVLKTASIVIWPIAGVVALNSKDKKAMHDMLAKTRVVRR